MRTIIIAPMLLALSSPAIGQVNTDCSVYGNHVNCRSGPAYIPPPPITSVDVGEALRSYEAGRAARAQREQDEQQRVIQQQAQIDRDRLMMMRRQAGKMINEGHCDDALNYMLEAGELGLAQEVKTLCAR